MGERRDAKKRETRERISDIATALFFERGFEAVTIDEIAEAAKVSKMTVHNYFARKEDLMLDREDELLLVPFRDALRARPKGADPIDTLHALVRATSDDRHVLGRFDAIVAGWWRVVDASPSLTARIRELSDQAAEGLALALSARPDGATRLAAALIVSTVRVARAEAIRAFERHGSKAKARATFLALIDRGFAACRALQA